MRTRYVFAAVAVIIIGIVVFSARQSGQTPSTSRLSVVASFYPLYFFASEIGGDKSDVFTVTPAGAEPHDYEPTAQDMARMENSRLVILLNGGGLEAWGERIKSNLDPRHTLVVTAGESLATAKVVEGEEETIDPHVWLSPKLAELMADKIAEGFVKADPANTSYYSERATTLKKKLANLDNLYASGLTHCEKKDIITSHAAFGYLAAAYDLNQVPITGLSPDEEPSPKELARVAAFAKANRVKYIFFESLVSPKLAQTIATEVGVQTMVLNPIEGLTISEIAAGKDYFSEMLSNLDNLKQALTCKE